jgi:hypothetical protein
MSGYNKDISSSLGPLLRDPTVFAGNVSTVVLAATLPAAAATALNGVVRVKITNLSTTARVAWRLAPRGTLAASVVLSADVASPDCGVIVSPGASEYFSFPASLALYVVATASAAVCVSTVLV